MLIRFAPGAVAPWSISYAVVDDRDQLVGRVVRCHKGERLPLLRSVDQPYWYLPMMDTASAKNVILEMSQRAA